ncbi:hypothetical protein [Streptomyces sp. NPDC006384]|uniref:hypothetical protein n=1 Tax=Streptomyces sp. NPDC006384 TaxID=3364745 RepID=UPI00368A27DC
MGPSGSGKSTLLRCAAGLEGRPAAGSSSPAWTWRLEEMCADRGQHLDRTPFGRPLGRPPRRRRGRQRRTAEGPCRSGRSR